MSHKTTNRGVAWLHGEVNALLDIWADQEIQEQLAGRLHNMCIYDKISRKLKDLGYDRTGEQCREKIKKLRRDYKSVIDNNYSPIFGRRLFYDKVHRIFGKSPVQKQFFRTDVKESNITVDNINENNDSLPLSQSDVELNVGSFVSNIIPENIFDDNNTRNETTTTDIENDSDKITETLNETHEEQNLIQNVNQQYHLFHESLKKNESRLTAKILQLDINMSLEDELQRERHRLSTLQDARRNAKSQEMEIYKTLLQMLANQKGIHF